MTIARKFRTFPELVQISRMRVRLLTGSRVLNVCRTDQPKKLASKNTSVLILGVLCSKLITY